MGTPALTKPRATTRLAVLAFSAMLVACSGLGDSSSSPPLGAAQPGEVAGALAYFEGTIDVATAHVDLRTYAPSSASGGALRAQDLPTGNGPNQILLHTVSAQWQGGGPLPCGANQLCGSVSLTNHYGVTVTGAQVVIDSTAPIGISNDGPWSYGDVAAGATAAARQWTFTLPTPASFTFKGHVSGTLGATVGPPSPPTNVAAVPADQAATVSWTPGSANGSPIVSYQITSTGGQVASCAAPCASATVSGLTNGTTYRFTVTATNSAVPVGQSAPSGPSNPVVPAGRPGAPTLTSAAPGNTSAAIGWVAGSANGSPIVSYQFFDGATPIGSCNVTGAPQCSSATSYTVSGLTNGVTYHVGIKATNGAPATHQSLLSNTAAVTPASQPDAPTNLSFVPGAASMQVSWTAPNNGGRAIDFYQVWVNGALSQSVVTTTAFVTNLPTCNYPSGTCGTPYSFFVYAHNAVGFSVGASGSAVPRVSYVGDRIAGIFTKAYFSGTCVGCHSGPSPQPDLTGGSPAGYSGATSFGALIYECPAHDAACSSSMKGFTLFTAGSAEHKALMQWVSDGNLR